MALCLLTKSIASDILFNISDDLCLLRLVVRTSGFHPDNSSSILLGDVLKPCKISYKAFFI